MQSTSHVECIHGIIKKDLKGRRVPLYDLCTTIIHFLKARHNNKEFIAWKESTPLILPINIYNTIFCAIDTEIDNFVTMTLTKQMGDHMN